MGELKGVDFNKIEEKDDAPEGSPGPLTVIVGFITDCWVFIFDLTIPNCNAEDEAEAAEELEKERETQLQRVQSLGFRGQSSEDLLAFKSDLEAKKKTSESSEANVEENLRTVSESCDEIQKIETEIESIIQQKKKG